MSGKIITNPAEAASELIRHAAIICIAGSLSLEQFVMACALTYCAHTGQTIDTLEISTGERETLN